MLTHIKFLSALLTGSVFFIGCLDPGDEIYEKSAQETGIVFVRIPNQELRNFRPDHSNADFRNIEGTNIYKLSPASPRGDTVNLTGKWTVGSSSTYFRTQGAAMDPEISRDNKRMLFSMRMGSSDPSYSNNARWHIYELDLITNELTQLTNNLVGDNFDPAYLPTGEIVFTSTRTQIVDEYERRKSPLLFVGSAERDDRGHFSSVRQISFNQSFDQNPMVHTSGKIYFCRWEHLGDPNKMPIFTVNPDGTGLFVLYGNHSPVGNASFLDMREMRDGRMVVSVMERGSDFAGGAIGLIDISKSDNALTYVTPGGSPYDGDNDQWLFTTPHPIMDNGVEKIVTAAAQGVVFENGNNPEGPVNYGIYVLDKKGGQPKLVWDDPNGTEFDPVPIEPADSKLPVPKQFQSSLPQFDPGAAAANAEPPTGFFFTTNVGLRSPSDGQMKSEEVSEKARYLRLLEAIPLPANRDNRGAEIGNTNLEKQRVMGYGSIREDGSFSVEVPANVSMHMQVLDENAMVIVNQRTWVQVMPGEKRMCTGCHASHDNDKTIFDLYIDESVHDEGEVKNINPEIDYMSGFYNAEKIMLHPAAISDTLDFADRYNPNKENTVQAILDRNCTECHNATEAAGGLNLAWNPALDPVNSDNPDNKDAPTHVYETLAPDDRNNNTENGNYSFYVSDDGARRSPLMWVLFGRQLDKDPGEDALHSRHTHDHTALWTKNSEGQIDPFLPENVDLLRLIEWIDGGTQYSNSVGY